MEEEKMGGWRTTLGDMAEFFCFVCKDAGDVRVCDYRNCLKSYHPGCVGKEDDFLESNEKFICDWHKCAKCGSDALYLCLCCPSSSTCGDCFGKVDFVPVKQSKGLSMGFCRSCFDMAVVTEKDNDEEAMVVFGGTPKNYKILFKDYWTVLNDKEHLKLLDLQTASIRHKRSLKYKEGKDSDEYHKPLGDSDCVARLAPDEYHKPLGDNDGFGLDEYHKPLGDNDGFGLDEYHKPLGDNDGVGPSSLLGTMEKPNEVQVTLKRKKAGKKTYVSWGSKELTEFLSCIGRDTSKPLEHSKVTDVVKEYVRQKNLVHDKKKKTVMCDKNLYSLFNKRKLKYNMIHSLLETHLSANAISEDESDEFADDNGYTVKKKPRNSLEAKIPNSVSGIGPIIPKSVSGINKKCLAALNKNNLNLIYLRRTLVVKLLTELDTFQQKVVGCLVRVKNDLKSYTYQMTKKFYQIGLVTGIKKSSEEYKIKDTRTNVLLCVSSMWDDVKISMLSEEDIEEDECNDLLLSAKKELFKRPTVAELEKKEASVRADIVNHWVDKELQRLKKELERAREKGWRQDIHDLSCKKMLLSSPDERQRRLEAIPEVIPDAEEESKETETESAADNPFEGNEDATEYVGGFLKVTMKESREGVTQPADPLEVGIDKPPEGASLQHDAACEVTFEAAGKALCNGGTPGPGMYTPLNTRQAAGKALFNGGTPGPGMYTPLNTRQAVGKALFNGGTPGPGMYTPLNTRQDGVIDIDNDEDENGSSHHKSGVKKDIIDLVSDDDEDLHIEQHEPERSTCGAPEATNRIAADAHHAPEAINGTAGHAHDGPEAINGVTVPTVRASKDLDGNTVPACSTPSQAMSEDVARPHVTLNGIGESVKVWHYLGPDGQEYGPFAMGTMREWQRLSYFPKGFRVWKAGQSRRRAVLLVDALRSQ